MGIDFTNAAVLVVDERLPPRSRTSGSVGGFGTAATDVVYSRVFLRDGKATPTSEYGLPAVGVSHQTGDPNRTGELTRLGGKLPGLASDKAAVLRGGVLPSAASDNAAVLRGGVRPSAASDNVAVLRGGVLPSAASENENLLRCVALLYLASVAETLLCGVPNNTGVLRGVALVSKTENLLRGVALPCVPSEVENLRCGVTLS